MPDLSRFAALAAKSGIVPPCSTVPSMQVEQEFPHEINVVLLVLPVPPRNDDARHADVPLDLCRNVALDPVACPDDAEVYAEALRLHGPMSYGVAMRVLGWGGTRAGQAEQALRAAGQITFNKLGRAILTEGPKKRSRSQ